MNLHKISKPQPKSQSKSVSKSQSNFHYKFFIDGYNIILTGIDTSINYNNKLMNKFEGYLYIDGIKKKYIDSKKEFNKLLHILQTY
jgi:hypothetical protein